MRRRWVSLLIPLLLAASLLLQGCEIPLFSTAATPSPAATPSFDVEPAETAPSAAPATPRQFTMRYDPNSALNPITGMNRDNILISALVYESLFVLDGNLNVEPLLCESWSTDDFITYVFVIKEGVAMSDGSFLTAGDVAYSLRLAKQRGRFVNRLTNALYIESDDELTVTVTLRSPNSRFISLLDIPIIKHDSIEQRIPPGTGPYILPNESGMRLERFTRYRGYSDLPVTYIYLVQCADDDFSQMFDDGMISIILDDPADAIETRLNRLHEKRYFNTTALLFVGFNAKNGVMRNPDIRRAIGCSIEREYIVDNIMPGQAVVAKVPIPPAYRLFKPEWEYNALDQFTMMALLFDRAGMEDFDMDSFLEVSDGGSYYSEFTVDFIVNSENIYRMQTAQRIANTLRQYGIDITVRELPWDVYVKALNDGTFDMYLGETMLGADFDLSPLLLAGPLDYGGTSHTMYEPYIHDFMVANTDEEFILAAERLLDMINRNAPFAPVLYKRYVLCSPMGAIHGAEPSQSSVFRNITSWTINLSLLS